MINKNKNDNKHLRTANTEYSNQIEEQINTVIKSILNTPIEDENSLIQLFFKINEYLSSNQIINIDDIINLHFFHFSINLLFEANSENAINTYLNFVDNVLSKSCDPSYSEPFISKISQLLNFSSFNFYTENPENPNSITKTIVRILFSIFHDHPLKEVGLPLLNLIKASKDPISEEYAYIFKKFCYFINQEFFDIEDLIYFVCQKISALDIMNDYQHTTISLLLDSARFILSKYQKYISLIFCPEFLEQLNNLMKALNIESIISSIKLLSLFFYFCPEDILLQQSYPINELLRSFDFTILANFLEKPQDFKFKCHMGSINSHDICKLQKSIIILFYNMELTGEIFQNILLQINIFEIIIPILENSQFELQTKAAKFYFAYVREQSAEFRIQAAISPQFNKILEMISTFSNSFIQSVLIFFINILRQADSLNELSTVITFYPQGKIEELFLDLHEKNNERIDQLLNIILHFYE